MSKTGFRAISVLAIAAIFSILIDVVYGIILPRLSPATSRGAHLVPVLGVGVLIASLIGGWVGYHDPTAGTLRSKMRIGRIFAVIVASLTLLLSLYLILNTYGS